MKLKVFSFWIVKQIEEKFVPVQIHGLFILTSISSVESLGEGGGFIVILAVNKHFFPTRHKEERL